MKLDDININNYKTGTQEKKSVLKHLATPHGNITQPNGGKLLLHQSTVTLTARMWPPIEEAEPPSNIFLGLPFIVWGIIIGCGIIFLLILASLFFYFYLLPRQHKYLSQTPFGSHHNHNTISSSSIGTAKNSYSSSSIGRLGESGTMASQQQQQQQMQQQQQQSHHHNHHIMQSKYHHHQQQQQQQQQQQMQQQQQYHQQQQHHHYQPSSASLMMINGEIYHQTVNCSGHCINNLINSQNNHLISSSNNRINNSLQEQQITQQEGAIASSQCNLQQSSSAHCIPETHKSMWAVNSFYDSNQEISSDQQSNYRTRSLPSWGKNGKPRPASTVDDLEELYAQVNFTKKRRNRMRNDNAAIIARCRSRSQNLTSLHLESEGIVVYDERTAL